MDWWVAELLRDSPVLLLSWVVWVIGSIVLHELAHGWAAIWQGDRTPIETGHMTWNPIVHMGWMSLGVFALVGIAWGAMPVNPSRFRSRHGDALVTFAGPAMNLALALGCVVLSALWGGYAQSVPNPMWENMLLFLDAGAYLNVTLAIFNLLPVPPLDGGRILASYVPSYRRLMQHPQAPMIAIVVLFLAWGRLGHYVTDPAIRATSSLTGKLQGILPGASWSIGRVKQGDATRQFEHMLNEGVEELSTQPEPPAQPGTGGTTAP